MCSDIMLENSDSSFHKRDTFYVVVFSFLIFLTYGTLLFERLRGYRYLRGTYNVSISFFGLK